MPDASPLFPILDDDPAFGLTARDLVSQSFKHWPTILTCVALVSVLTWGSLILQPPSFETSAKVWVQTEQQGTPSFLSGIAAYRENQEADPVDRKMETEIQLLLSRSNVEAVVSQLGITKAQLIQSPLAGLIDRLPTWIRAKKTRTAAQVHNDVVALFMKGIAVETMRSKAAEASSNVLEVHFACLDRSLAAPALSALLQQYLRFGAQHNVDLGESTFRLVDGKLAEASQELKSLDDDILQLTVRQSSQANVATDANAAHVTGHSNVDATLSSGRTGAPSSLALLKSATIEMQSKLEEARQLYTDESPLVRHLQEELRDLQDRLNSGVRASADLDVRLERLERLRELALERFTELRKKRDQVELYLKLNPVEADSRVITESALPPDRPKSKVVFVIALLAPFGGAALGLMLAGLREYFDHRLRSAEDVRRYLGIDTLGVLPKLGIDSAP